MTRKALGFLLGLALLTPNLAFAQAKAAPAKAGAPAGGDNVTYKQKTVYDFDDDVVEGDLVRPDGEFVDSRRAAKHSSLIKIRENFIPEMLKSAEDI
jgi:hypothetical protein